jgi:hypothetical protein
MKDDADTALWRLLRVFLLFFAHEVSAYNEIGVPGS